MVHISNGEIYFQKLDSNGMPTGPKSKLDLADAHFSVESDGSVVQNAAVSPAKIKWGPAVTLNSHANPNSGKLKIPSSMNVINTTTVSSTVPITITGPKTAQALSLYYGYGGNPPTKPKPLAPTNSWVWDLTQPWDWEKYRTAVLMGSYDFDAHPEVELAGRIGSAAQGSSDESQQVMEAWMNVLQHNLLPMLPPGYFWDFQHLHPSHYLRGHDADHFGRISLRKHGDKERSFLFFKTRPQELAWCCTHALDRHRDRPREELIMLAATTAMIGTEADNWKRFYGEDLVPFGVPRFVKQYREMLGEDEDV